MGLFTKQKETHRLENLTYCCQEKRMKGRDAQGIWVWLVHTAVFKMVNQQGLLYSTGNSTEWYMAACMGGEFVEEWIHTHIYVWLSFFAIHLKISQYC